MVNLFYHRCRVSTFKMQCSAHQKIATIENSKLRASTYKFYRWICSRTDSRWSIFAQLEEIRKATGLSKDAIINARRELQRLNLIGAHSEGGPAGGYYFNLTNADTSLSLDWGRKPTPRYFRLPYASMLSAIYPEKWTGTDAFVYDALLDRMSRTGKSMLPLASHWFKAVSKNTLYAAEDHLEQTGFIRVKNSGKDRVVEILNPETSQSMPPKGVDQEPIERAYYVDGDTGARKLLNEEDFTPEVFETYFRKSLPRSAEWSPRSNAHCPFHHDDVPSLYINVETGQFICYACGVEGNKLVTFEMRLLDTDDVQQAWSSVAKKIGIKLCPRSRGKPTHEHLYRDDKGYPRYRVLRYEDGSASYQRYTGIFFKPGLAGKKRILYNLPEVIAADVVLFVEGEKKADILTELRLLDSNGKLVAVTTTGGADSWRFEHVEEFMDKRLVLLPDTDGPGQRYSAHVQASLQRAAIEFRVVDFDGYGNDFRDYLSAHGISGLLRFINCDWLMSVERREREEEESKVLI